MSHLIETYSLLSGLKIDKPYIYERFFPIPFEKYITFHGEGSTQAKQYDFWNEVINILRPVLGNNNIGIVQVGTDKDTRQPGTYYTSGKTDINNVAYIISKSMLHLGCDSFPVHFASYYDIPIVSLYSSVLPSHAGPYWGNKEKQILFSTVKEGRRPTYAAQERPKQINNANPEEIAEAVCKLINIKLDYPYKTVYKGISYKNATIEMVPDCIADLKKLGFDLVTVRMDYHHNEEALVGNLERTKCNIVTSKPIDFKILQHYRQNIKEFYYMLNGEYDLNFVKVLIRNNFNPKIIACSDDPKLVEYKSQFMDYGGVSEKHIPTKESLSEFDNIDESKLYYKSSRFLISKGNIYAGKFGWDNDLKVKHFSHEFVKAKINRTFLEEISSYYVAEKI